MRESYTRHNGTKTKTSFFMFALLICLNSVFLWNTDAQVNLEPIAAPDGSKYTFERISVDGVDFLALAASSDFEDFAGYTKSDDGEKNVAFTLIDGVFKIHDFPGSKNTYFYALGNNGSAR